MKDSKTTAQAGNSVSAALPAQVETLAPAHPSAVPPAYTREELLAGKLRLTKVMPYQQAAPPFIGNLSLAVLSGLLLVFAFPDWNLWSLGWIAPAPLIMAAAREQRFWRAFLLGLVTGTIFYVGSSYWVTYSMHNYGGMSLPISYLAGIPLAAALGIFIALFAAILSWAIARLGGWAILSAPVIWAATEWLKVKLTGMGWNDLAYSQSFQPNVIQLSRWGGVYLVGSLLVAVSTGLVFAMVYLERRRGLVVLTIAGALAVGNLLYGQRITSKPQVPGTVHAGAVQPDVPINGDWENSAFVDELLRHHIKLSEDLIKSAAQQTGRPELIIWPESPMPFQYDQDEGLRQTLADFTTANKVSLLFNTWETPAGDGSRNSAVLIGPSGDKISEYDKIYLLPFGEYVPGRGWIPLMDRVSALVGEVTPGTTPTVSEVAGAKVGTLICFETTRPELARELRRAGATALVQISNERWFGPTAAPRQMLAHSIFRAVENNVELIRATNSGLSAEIDPVGNVHGLTPMFETAAESWPVKTTAEAKDDAVTFYTRHGDVFAIGCTVLTLLLGLAGFAARLSKAGQKD
ncbi:MAG TPA: apolipoprotein N-acyltransferase [Blastocatellia bacterium]